MEDGEFKYMRVEDFFRDAEQCTLMEDVMRDRRKERMRPITTSQAYKAAGINAEAFSQLGNQVFGAEVGM